MRQPIVARPRRRTRQQRLLRSLFFLVVLILLIALVGKLGGKKSGPPTPRVSFVATTSAESDTKTPDPAAVKKESDRIVTMLNDWYQQGFVDPALFGDGTFKGVKKNFSRDAQARFDKDITSLTIGDARTEVRRVVPGRARADITVFFQSGSTARYAVAAITFTARATMKDKSALPLQISQTATLNLERRSNGDWIVTYYNAHESQDSVQASPSAVPS